VAQGEDQEKKDSSKGFAGLSSLVSDVDTTVAQSTRDARSSTAAPPRETPAANPPPSENEKPGQRPYQAPPQAGEGPSAGKWLVGIGVVVGLIWLLAQSGDKSSSPSHVYAPSSDPPAVISPGPTLQASLGPPAAPPRPIEERPPVGSGNVLTSAQIRYCVAEKIRLDAAEGAVNNYIDAHVDRFNGFVEDYNSRCGQFRYRGGALESARSDVEVIRPLLVAEGRARFEVRPGSTSERSLSETPRPAVPAALKSSNAQHEEGDKNRSARDVDSDLAMLKPNERQSIDSACLSQRLHEGPAAYSRCVSAKLKALNGAGPSPDLTGLNTTERQSIDSACLSQRLHEGPGAYNTCVAAKLRAFEQQGSRPDISRLSAPERQSIDSACLSQRLHEGPAAYNTCVSVKLMALDQTGPRPDLSGLNTTERQSIDSACLSQRLHDGPAAYNACLSAKLRALDQQGSRPDISRLSTTDRQSLDSACLRERLHEGPASYNACLARQLTLLGNR
jgi:hypothetical protein